MQTVDEEPKPNFVKTMLWGLAFMTGMFGTPIAGWYLGWSSTKIMIGMFFAMLLLIPMVRASIKEGAKHGLASPAMRRYNKRAIIWSFAYFAALFFSVWIYNNHPPKGLLLWAIAVLPAIPIFYFIWTLNRYFQEEMDEYIRMRNINAAMIATGFLLGLATLWGFLETFKLVPHVPGWMAVPVWAAGLGLGQCMNKLRGV